MDMFDNTKEKLAEIDLLFCERLGAIGLYQTNKLIDTLQNNVEEYKRAKKISVIKDFLKDLERYSLDGIETNHGDSFKENVPNKINNESIRPQRKARQKYKSVTEQDNQKYFKNLEISSEPSTIETNTIFYNASNVVKTESMEMPPPAFPGRRGRPKKEKISGTEVKERKQPVRTKKKVESISRDSDVIYLQNEIVTINIDSDEEINSNICGDGVESVNGDDASNHLNQEKSSTNKLLKLNQSRTTEAAIESDVDPQRKKSNLEYGENEQLQSASDISDNKQENGSEKSENLALLKEATVNNTKQTEGNTPQISSTFIVEDANFPDRKKSSCSVYEDALEQIHNVVKVTKGAMKKQVNKGPKPIFNLFGNSPVKKRVEAFERLGAETAATTRVTRTKTKNKAKEQQDAVKNTQIPIPESTSKICTPFALNRYLPHNQGNSTSKTIKNSVYTTPISTTKTMSALKASQQEFREREQRRKEKEVEATRKKEQLLKAQIEEKKRKREERELRVKELRDAQEKVKIMMLESQAQKEEKLKRQQAEKQEKLLKMREETEKKRHLLKQKNEKLKREEEQRKTDEELRRWEEAKWIQQEEERIRKMAEKRRQEENEKMLLSKSRGDDSRKLPLYMVMKAPLLPTYDCYDSGDEEGQKKTVTTLKPDFIRSEQMRVTLNCMDYVDSKLKNTLFCLKAQTPNLREIFETIDPKKLRRNSSAVWKHAPRFTLMPTLRIYDENSDGS